MQLLSQMLNYYLLTSQWYDIFVFQLLHCIDLLLYIHSFYLRMEHFYSYLTAPLGPTVPESSNVHTGKVTLANDSVCNCYFLFYCTALIQPSDVVLIGGVYLIMFM